LHHNIRALETLLMYNIYDAVNLETLMVIAYNMNLENTPFYDTHRIPLPEIPEVPYRADRETVERIKSRTWIDGDLHQGRWYSDAEWKEME
jgi:hypothetical protein